MNLKTKLVNDLIMQAAKRGRVSVDMNTCTLFLKVGSKSVMKTFHADFVKSLRKAGYDVLTYRNSNAITVCFYGV